MVDALEVITGDPQVESILFNIFGGITRCDEVARGILEALGRMTIEDPMVVRLDGTNAEEGRLLLTEDRAPEPVRGGDDAVRGRTSGRGRQDLMAIIVDSDTRLVVQGVTGREGSFHATRNKDYGTNVVAGVTPGKGGGDVSGIPVFDSVREAVAETDANTTMVFVSARSPRTRSTRRIDAGIGTVICVTEGIPAHDMLRVYNHIRPRGVTMIGPNCPGALSPGKANVGIIPGEIFEEGGVGLVSRSGTLTYQIGHELTQLGIGQSTIVGIGGDPVVGSSFIDILERFESDSETELVVMVGEIGGAEEEKAAAFIETAMTKPVVAYIAGFTAPPGRRWATPARSSRAQRGPRRQRRTRTRPAASASARTRRRSHSSGGRGRGARIGAPAHRPCAAGHASRLPRRGFAYLFCPRDSVRRPLADRRVR